MESMKGKRKKIDAAFGRLVDRIQNGHLLASADPVGFLDTVAAELKHLLKETDMGSMKGKQEEIDAAFGRLADMIQNGHLLAGTDTVGFLDTIATELKDLRADNVKLKGTVSIKQDRVNDLEKALRDTLGQLERVTKAARAVKGK